MGSKLALEEAIEAIETSVRTYDPALHIDSFLIECMVASPRAEFIVGVSCKLRLSDTERTLLVTAIQAIAAFAEQHKSSLVELDVNPVILDTEGRVTAVDALLRLARG